MAPNCKGPASATAEPQPSLSAVILHRSSPNMSSLTTSLSKHKLAIDKSTQKASNPHPLPLS